METTAHRPGITAPPIRNPLTRWRPKAREPANAETIDVADAQPREQAGERFCFECRDARYDKALSVCECTSVASEFAHQRVFSGQVACGWFIERRTERAVRWSICSGRML